MRRDDLTNDNLVRPRGAPQAGTYNAAMRLPLRSGTARDGSGREAVWIALHRVFGGDFMLRVRVSRNPALPVSLPREALGPWDTKLVCPSLRRRHWQAKTLPNAMQCYNKKTPIELFRGCRKTTGSSRCFLPEACGPHQARVSDGRPNMPL